MQGTLRDWKLELTLNSSATTIKTGNKGGSWVAWLRQSHLAETEPCHSRERGMAAQVHVLAIEDEYFEYWHNQTFGEYDVRLLTPVHFCEVPIASCQGQTRYRNPLHVDVFRVLSLEDTATLGWLTDVHRSRFDGPGSPGAGGAGDGAGPGAGAVAATPGAGGQGLEPGAPGIAGLAAALGDRDRGDLENQARLGALRAQKAERMEAADERGQEPGRRERGDERDRPKRRTQSGDLLDELQGRRPKEPRLSALDLGNLEKKEKKLKQKKKKQKKREEKGQESSSVSTSSTSSDDQVFRGAALPKGMERLRRVHQKHPGRIASRSLQRLQELLMNAQGRGTAFQEEETAMLPAVAVGYLAQVFFQQHPPSVVGLRSSKELRTLAHCIDLICRNDPLRSLDMMIQRLKAIELSHIQCNWHQASQLELVMSEDQLATFRQEVNAAQQEVKADLALQQGAGQRRWSRPWRYEAPGTGDAPKTGDVKEGGGGDKPPDNAQREPRKGKGKGKKGGKKGGYRW